MGERLIHGLNRSLEKFRLSPPDVIGRASRIDQLDKLTTEGLQVLEAWAHEFYWEIMDTPDENRKAHRDRVLQRYVHHFTPEEIVTRTKLLLQYTEGFGRGEWVPEYIYFLMAQYTKHDPSQAQQFFRMFWDELNSENTMPWLSDEVKNGIIEGLKPYVDIQEAFESTTVTYSQTRAAGASR